MSNRFVSGGTIGPSGEITETDSSAAAPPASSAAGSTKNAEWEAVQAQLEADRRRREEAREKAATGEEKSLYDILQENKAAKQAAFEEQTKVRNQFRALDDDEIDFLDDLKEKKRREEDQVKRETEEGLKAFRERQKSDGGVDDGSREGESWGVGRKRKRVKEKDVKGLRRKVSEAEGEKKEEGPSAEARATKKNEEEETPAKSEETKKPALGLVDYGSDDSD